jgi:peptide/nickel transport system permease protein
MNLSQTINEWLTALPPAREWPGLARRNKRLALGLLLVAIFYVVAFTADFLAPYDYRAQARREPSAPPSEWHWRGLRPFVYPVRLTDPLNRTYAEDTAQPYDLELLARGFEYQLLGVIPTDRHLFGVRGAGTDGPRVYLLGTDALGRDRFSRLLRAARFSLLVGPLGALLASVLGVALGCAAGYRRRRVDALLMRAADTMMALPALVIILAARAAFPLELPPWRAGVMMVTIFALVGWAEMARLARGLVLAVREREFVTAARSLGLTEGRILWRHVLPNLARPLVVQFMLLLPTFLLAETALSFLGVGLQEPEPSWGNMLAEAANVTLLNASPFVLLTPALAIFAFVLAVRLCGDGLKK